MILVSILLAILALSFLIFIHELGHYFMAKKEGMRVETFSIGMGSPIISWEWKETSWQLGWIPFGGYVKIAGTDTDKAQDLTKIKDGYFSKSPWARIKVSFMGPLVNILFALLCFALLWVNGGREKNFSEYTKKIGLIDPTSELFMHGVRAGDEIWALDGTPYQGIHDLMYLAVTHEGPLGVKGAKINYATGEKSPFELEIQPYSHPLRQEKEFLTTGILAPASYLIYDGQPLLESSPLKNSGLQPGDRIVWVDGTRIFSLPELSLLLNDGRVLLTIERNGKKFLARVPRIKTQELKMTPNFRDELTDWQFAAELNSTKFPGLMVLPYNLTNEGVVENPMAFIDAELESHIFPSTPASSLDLPLLAGDKIVAVDGMQVKHSAEILKLLQNHKLHIIVERDSERPERISWQLADQIFDKSIKESDINIIAESIGQAEPHEKSGNAVLLKPVIPKSHREIYASSPHFEVMNQAVEAEKKQIAALDDPFRKRELLKALEKNETKLELGVPIHDQKIEYNPVPTTLFYNVIKEIVKTLKSLFTGALNPKWMSGPVGIVSLFQEQTRSGLGDTLYWLGTISLNLGFLNLLPIPLLDGGTILINLIELVSGRKIKPQTLEKIILPFALLLILFFIFLTYHDISRLFRGFK